MPRKRNREREERIAEEIVVDCYTDDEEMTAWCIHLDEVLPFPFRAKAARSDPASPLNLGETAEVVGMANNDCGDTMRVLVKIGGRKSAVRMENLDPLGPSADARQAFEDWKYWARSL